MTTNLIERKLALDMLNEMHETMGTELVYKTKFEKLAIDKIAEKHFAKALEAQAKQIEALQAESEYWRARYAALAQKGVNV